ncbi:MAG: site-specific integrase [Clostridiales Family XIII bacterium]|uniref:Site-specific integrase n=1 Tax=Hominibacterium faecale TaxID=2839743 RepID=A0A9J6QWE3_9FIRM|nr:site-specific integrase [Hominibacterium faecale]MCI7302202.1 site-specific integrase [Clostridia bacterium]MCU7379550.1 site-specific integrase [Hominibacterium faecale]MDY3009668.1 site-specific integrase [Clostridiales Family XIII bacterium]
MAKKTNCTINGKEYYRIYRKVGMKVNKMGIWVDDRKAFYGSCKREAEEAYQEYMNRKKSGQTATETCLGQVMDQWVQEVFKSSSLAKSTKAKYITDFEKHLKPSKLAGLPLAEISALDIQQFYNDSTASETSIRSVHNLLRRFFKYAELQSICPNITHSVAPPRKSKAGPAINNLTVDVWEDNDLQKLISEMDDHRLRLMVIMAVNTGCRIAELLALTYDDIKGGILYVSKQLLEVRDTDTKGGQAKWIQELEDTKSFTSNRAVPLSAAVMDEIERHRAWQRTEMIQNGYRTEYLFTTENGTWYYKRNVTRALKRLYKRIGVPYHKFHSFRHTFGTNLSRTGVPIEETAKLMGHSDISITAKYYINVNAERKRTAVEKITMFSLK